jgi:hypothetical protein
VALGLDISQPGVESHAHWGLDAQVRFFAQAFKQTKTRIQTGRMNE